MWLTTWFKRWWQQDASTVFLDVLLEEIAESDRLQDRLQRSVEVIRRFIHDVEWACRIAKVPDPRREASDIMDQAMRTIGAEPVEYFSRELVRIMKLQLGTTAVSQVLFSLYLRQFLSALPPDGVRYLEGILNFQGDVAALAASLNEAEAVVAAGVETAFAQLPDAVAAEYTDDEVSARTDGVWTIAKMRER